MKLHWELLTFWNEKETCGSNLRSHSMSNKNVFSFAKLLYLYFIQYFNMNREPLYIHLYIHPYICQFILYVFSIVIRTLFWKHTTPNVVQKYLFMAFLYYTQTRNKKYVFYIHIQHWSPIIYIILVRILLARKRTNNEDKFNED